MVVAKKRERAGRPYNTAVLPLEKSGALLSKLYCPISRFGPFALLVVDLVSWARGFPRPCAWLAGGGVRLLRYRTGSYIIYQHPPRVR